MGEGVLGQSEVGTPTTPASGKVKTYAKSDKEYYIKSSDGFEKQMSFGKANLTATVNPSSSDDVNVGYIVGSVWINTTTDTSFINVDNTEGAAVWKQTSGTQNSGTQEVFYNADYDTDLSDFRVQTVGTSSAQRFTFFVPHDFISLTSAVLVMIPDANAAGSGKDIDLDSDYGKIGESRNNHSESDTTTIYDFTGKNNQFTEIDISGILSLLAALDYVGIRVTHNTIGGALRYLGIRLRYT